MYATTIMVVACLNHTGLYKGNVHYPHFRWIRCVCTHQQNMPRLAVEHRVTRSRLCSLSFPPKRRGWPSSHLLGTALGGAESWALWGIVWDTASWLQRNWCQGLCQQFIQDWIPVPWNIPLAGFNLYNRPSQRKMKCFSQGHAECFEA